MSMEPGGTGTCETSAVEKLSAPSEVKQTLSIPCADGDQSMDVAAARKRKLWREASSRYRCNPKTVRARLDKAKARSAKWRSSKYKEDMEIVKRQIRELKKKRIRHESKNERFWRLLRRKDEKRVGYYNLAFGWEIDEARGSGFCRNNKYSNLHELEGEQTIVRSEEMVKVRNEFIEEFDKFYAMLAAIKSDSIKLNNIPESFDNFFKDRQLTLTSDFVKSYIDCEDEM